MCYYHEGHEFGLAANATVEINIQNEVSFEFVKGNSLFLCKTMKLTYSFGNTLIYIKRLLFDEYL